MWSSKRLVRGQEPRKSSWQLIVAAATLHAQKPWSSQASSCPVLCTAFFVDLFRGRFGPNFIHSKSPWYLVAPCTGSFQSVSPCELAEVNATAWFVKATHYGWKITANSCTWRFVRFFTRQFACWVFDSSLLGSHRPHLWDVPNTWSHTANPYVQCDTWLASFYETLPDRGLDRP